jgi:hypothetical protein
MIKLKSILKEDAGNNIPKTPDELFTLAKTKKLFGQFVDSTSMYSDSDKVSWSGGLKAADDFWNITLTYEGSVDRLAVMVRCTKLNKKAINTLKADFQRLNKTGETSFVNDYSVLPHTVATPEEHEMYNYQYSLTSFLTYDTSGTYMGGGNPAASKTSSAAAAATFYKMIKNAFARLVTGGTTY